MTGVEGLVAAAQGQPRHHGHDRGGDAEHGEGRLEAADPDPDARDDQRGGWLRRGVAGVEGLELVTRARS